MNFDHTVFQNVVVQFEILQSAVIDSSSIIYLEKTGCLNVATQILNLYTIKSVILEIGFCPPNISVLTDTFEGSTDTLLVLSAHTHNYAIISEDRGVLRKAQKACLPFFNALMVLNYMYFQNVVSADEYKIYINRLRSVARYSEQVWEYGRMVFNEITEMRVA